MKNHIDRLVKKYGLSYEHGRFSGVTVIREPCWRIRSDLNPNGVLVHSPKEADEVLRAWQDQLRKQQSNKAVSSLTQRISQKAKELNAECDTREGSKNVAD